MRVFCAGPHGPLAFENARSTIEAWRSEDVAEAFARVETALARGHHVAGFVAYEAGSAFVPRQPRSEARDVPYVCLGVYGAPSNDVPGDAGALGALGPLVPGVSRTRYERDVATILDGIRDGDVYQVNYSVPFAFSYAGNAAGLYAALTARDAYPYAAFVENESLAIVSCSPELFVQRTPGRLVTKPMKGTARPQNASDLDDEKNRAEHVMIVDLLRNDMHRLSDSVSVERLFDVETYPRFVTMTSTISAHVLDDLMLGAIFAAMFPCGSVTGAPKVTAMHAIAATERRDRGIFCGSIGYCAPDRSGIWNVAIRTAAIDRRSGRGTLQVGGGIVADSDARSEWAEIVTKRAFFDAIAPDYALLETLLREEDGTLRYLDAHMERLERAADDLHIDHDAAAIRSALRDYPARGPVVLRLQVERDGSFAVTDRPFATVVEPVDVCWSGERLDSSEPLLRYKTTWRPQYDRALAEARSAGCFDAVLVNERDEIADGARTSIFIRRGSDLITPPIESGALPGILRSRMLRSGAAREENVSSRDLAHAEEFYVGSSVRGLLRARFVAPPAPKAARSC